MSYQPTTLVVVPAYGRDYKSKKAVMEDWDGGKDFKTNTWGVRGYVTKSEVPAGMAVEIRYNKLQRVIWIPATKGS